MRIQGKPEAARKSRRLRHGRSVAPVEKALERVGSEHAALDAGDVRSELALAAAEALLELFEPPLALLERFRADERLRLELSFELLELRLADVEFVCAAAKLLLELVEPFVATLQPLRRHERLSAWGVLDRRLQRRKRLRRAHGRERKDVDVRDRRLRALAPPHARLGGAAFV